MKVKVHDISSVVRRIKKGHTEFPELVHCRRFLTGVVYALAEYYQMVISSTTMISDEKEYNKETDNVLTSILANQPTRENGTSF